MPPLRPGDGGDDRDPDAGDGAADDHDDVGFRPPLPPEDRLWRHPSEVGRPRPEAPAPAGRSRGRTAALALASGAVGAVVALGVVSVLGGFDDRVVERQVAVAPADASDEGAGDVAALVERTAPSVAALTVGDGERTGSAVVLRSDGYLVTEADVVRGADELTVVLHGGEVVAGELVGIDELTGVAVVRAEADPLVPAVLGRTAALAAGARTVLVAAATDAGWHTSVSTGVVSTMARRIETADGSARYGMIVVDTPFAAGAPGGALVDASGAVVGIASAGVDQGATHGIATPIELVRHVADQLIADGVARHVWLGLEGTDLDVADAAPLGLDGGAVVEDVAPDGPAARSGLVAGDVVVSVDGEATPSMAALIVALRLHLPGDVVVLGVHRDGELVDARVELAAKGGG